MQKRVMLDLTKEADCQRAVFLWAGQPAIRKRWPELALLHHVKNETREGAAAVAMDKAQGVKKGVPDLCLPVARGKYHGLYIEMKSPKGRLSEAQAWWLDALLRQGYAACTCHGYKEAEEVLTWYLNLAKN